MPQIVALLNGLGGLASALVAILSVLQAKDAFSAYTAIVALIVGCVTFTGSLVAAGKLHKVLPQKPVVWKGHTAIIAASLIAMVAVTVLADYIPAAIIIGANDADAKAVIICNFDEMPGYAGVPNPLYKNANTIMLLGDAKQTVSQLIESF